MSQSITRLCLAAALAVLSATGVAQAGKAAAGKTDGETVRPAATPQDLLRPGAHETSIRVGTLDRWFVVYTPPGYRRDKSYPLVIALHGAHGGMRNMYKAREDLRTLARERNFVLVFPNGQNTTDHREGRSVWNADFCCSEAMTSGIDDMQFILAMTDFLSGVMAIDEDRRHIVGFSNGGMLAQKIAAEHPGRYASFVSMGAVPGYVENGTTWTYPMTRQVPMMLMHGTEDTTIAFNGGTPDNNPGRRTLSFQDALRVWAKHNGCQPNPPTLLGKSMPKHSIGESAHVIRYEGCAAATLGVAVQGAEHTWLAVNKSDFNGTLRAIEFFESHPR